MRASSKAFVSSVGLGVLAVSYAIGTTVQPANSFGTTSTTSDSGANPSLAPQPTAEPSATATATPSASPSKAASSSSSKKSSGTTKKKSSSSSSSGSSSSSSSSSGGSSSGSSGGTSEGSSGGNSSSSTTSQTGASIGYKYGAIQLKVTKTDGKITDIVAVQFSATNGRASAESYLIQYAIESQGSGFSNISGATFTTDAFKQALTSALNKF